MFIVLLEETVHGTTAVLVRKGCTQEVASTYDAGCVCGFLSWHTLISVCWSGWCVWGAMGGKSMHNKLHSPLRSTTTSSPLYRQQTVSRVQKSTHIHTNRHLHTHTHTLAHKPFNSGSRHLLARHQGQPIHTVTTQQGSNSRAPLKSHYCTSLFKLVPQW